MTNFAGYDTIKTHKACQKTVGGSLPHKPWSFDERGSNIFLPSPIPLQGEKRGWLKVNYVTWNDLLVLLGLLIQVAMLTWMVADSINNKK